MKTLLSKKTILVALIAFNFLPLISFATNDTLGGGLPSGTTIPTGNSVVSNPSQTPGGPVSFGGGQYQPITPGYQSFFGGEISFEGMIQRIFILSIFFIVILSVIMIIWGGVEYMGSESVFAKGAGKERIFAALSGLLIALVSILLISTLVTGLKGDTLQINIFQTSS